MNVVGKASKKCGQMKSLDNFALNKKAKNGYFYWCKACAALYNKARNQRLYTEEFVREKNLKQLYGMTPSEYQALFVTQNGVFGRSK